MPTNKLRRRRGVLHTPWIAPLCNVVTTVRGVLWAVTYRAYATRWNHRNTLCRLFIPKHPESYIGHGKNYVLCRKNFIRHNSNCIRHNFPPTQRAWNHAPTNQTTTLRNIHPKPRQGAISITAAMPRKRHSANHCHAVQTPNRNLRQVLLQTSLTVCLQNTIFAKQHR